MFSAVAANIIASEGMMQKYSQKSHDPPLTASSNSVSFFIDCTILSGQNPGYAHYNSLQYYALPNFDH